MAQLRRDDFTTQATFDNIGITERSVTGAVGGWIEARKGRYVKLQGYNSLSRDEDLDLSTVVRASLLTLTPEPWMVR